MILVFSVVSAQACEGFNNAMSALESTLQAPPKKTQSAKAVPPMASINAALDELEEAVRDHREKSGQSYPASYTRRQKPRL